MTQMQTMRNTSTLKVRPRTAPSIDSREYRLGEFIPGYSGHIPKFENTFGFRFTEATRAALKIPPVPSRPVSAAFIPCRSQRILETTYDLPGNNFTGLAEPSGFGYGENADNRKYIQGSTVDLVSYYEALEATNYDKLTTVKSGLPSKARSHIDNGDRFYFSGRHMWETTYMDSFHRHAAGAPPPTDPLQPDPADAGAVRHRYAVLQAVVGRRRLDELEGLLREKLTRLLKTGQTLSAAFKVFDRDRSGRVNLGDFAAITRMLGIHVTETEAHALFGRYDRNADRQFSCDEWFDSMTRRDAPAPAPAAAP